MSWKKELKVGDKFICSDYTHYAVVIAVDISSISFTWHYMHNGEPAGSPVLELRHFYGLPFILPITPLLDSLL